MRQYHNSNTTNNSSRFAGAPLTKWLMITFAITFFVDITGADDFGRLKPWLALSSGNLVEIWRWITYPLVDLQIGGWLFGMISLYVFGRMLEQSLGTRRFGVFLLLTTVTGSIVFSLMSLQGGLQILTGTNGLAFAIVTLTALLYPNLTVRLLIPPVPLKLKTLAFGLLSISAIMMIAQERNAAVSLAYLSGAGLAYLVSLKMKILDIGKSKVTRMPRQKTTKRTSGQTKKKVGMRARTKINIRETEIDEILDKVSREGIGNLTPEEREILKFASKK